MNMRELLKRYDDQNASSSAEVVQLRADAAALRARFSALEQEMRAFALDQYEDGGKNEGLFASSTVAEMMRSWADKVAAILSESK